MSFINYSCMVDHFCRVSLSSKEIVWQKSSLWCVDWLLPFLFSWHDVAPAPFITYGTGAVRQQLLALLLQTTVKIPTTWAQHVVVHTGAWDIKQESWKMFCCCRYQWHRCCPIISLISQHFLKCCKYLTQYTVAILYFFSLKSQLAVLLIWA